MAATYLKGDFIFSTKYGFSGSAQGRHDARDHPAVGDDEYGDGTYVEQMKRGGQVKRADGGDVGGKRASKPDVGYPGDNDPPSWSTPDALLRYKREFRLLRADDGGDQTDYAKGGPIKRAIGGPAMPAGARPAAPGPSPNPMSRATISMPVGDAAQAAAGMVQAGKAMGARQAMGGLQQAARQAAMRQQRPMPAVAAAPAAQPPMPVQAARVPGMSKGGKLSASERHALPSADFALPGERYPINDANHARAALSRVSQNGSPAEKSRVRGAVHRKFPTIGSK